MADCRTQKEATAVWSGKIRLTNLSQGVWTDDTPWPMGPTARLYFNDAYLYLRSAGIAQPEWDAAYHTWNEYWGLTPAYPSIPADCRVLAYTVEFGDIRGLGYGLIYKTTVCAGYWKVGSDWVWYGPPGGAQGVDTIEVAFTQTYPHCYLLEVSSDLTPTWRARQDFTDDKVAVGRWYPADDATCRIQIASDVFGPSDSTFNIIKEPDLPRSIYDDLGMAFSMAWYTAPIGNGGGASILDTNVIELADIQSPDVPIVGLDKLYAASDTGADDFVNYPAGNYPGTTRYLASASGTTIGFRRIASKPTWAEGVAWINAAGNHIWLKPPYIISVDWHPRNYDDSDNRAGPRLDFGMMDGDSVTPLYHSPGLSGPYNLPSTWWYDLAALWLGSPIKTASCVEADLDATDENPQAAHGGGESGFPAMTLHDRRCRLWAWPLTETDYDNEPWFPDPQGVVVLEHAASVNLNLPPGLAIRPTLWTAVAGATVDAGDNDLWTLAAANATVKRDLTTRYYTQMDQLEGGVPPGWAYEAGWPIWLKANLTQIDVSGDDAPTQALLTADEDITNWSNFSYLRVNLPGTYNGRFQVRLTYSIVSYSDPKYSSGQRWVEWTWSRTTGQVAIYGKDRDGAPLTLTAALRQFDVDLACPDGGGVPTLLHVDRVEVIFLDAPEAGDTVTLGELLLIESDRTGEENHFLVGGKPAWDFFQSNYFGLGWVVDGLANAQWAWHGDDRQENEYGLLYIDHREHDPDFTGDAYDLSVAKSLEQLCVELGLQEGLTATYSAVALDALTKDADGNVLGSTAWWWIRRHADRQMTAQQQLELGIACGTLDIEHARGVPMTIIVEKNFAGKPHGIAKWGARRARSVGSVKVYWKDNADAVPAYTLLGSVTPDAHGRYRGPNCAEDGGARSHADDRSREYRVQNLSELGPAVNRSYWWIGALGAIPNLHALLHLTGFTLLSDCGLFAEPGYVRIARGSEWRDRLALTSNAAALWGNLWANTSREEWAQSDGAALTSTDLAGLQQGLGTRAPDSLGAYTASCALAWQQFLYVVAFADDQHHLLRFESFNPHDPLPRVSNVVIGAGDDAPGSLCVDPNTWDLLAAIPNGGGTDLYRSNNQGATWTSLLTVADLQYPVLVQRWPYTWLLGYNDGAHLGAQGSLVVRRYKVTEAATADGDAVTVGAADEGRPALLAADGMQPTYDWALHAFAPKAQEWDAAGATPGRAEYVSTDSGETWELREIHG